MEWSGHLVEDLVETMVAGQRMSESLAREVLEQVLSKLVWTGVPVDAYRGEGERGDGDLSRFLVDALYVDRVRLYALGVAGAPGLGASPSWMGGSVHAAEQEHWGGEAGRRAAQEWVKENREVLDGLDEFRRRLLTGQADAAQAEVVWSDAMDATVSLDTDGPRSRALRRPWWH